MTILASIFLVLLIIVLCVALLGWGKYAQARHSNEVLKLELEIEKRVGEFCHNRHISAANDLEDSYISLELLGDALIAAETEISNLSQGATS